MRARLLALIVPALALAGCGDGAPRHISTQSLPLAPETRIVLATEDCDRGSDAYCSRNLVVVGPRDPAEDPISAADRLRRAQRTTLRRAGWRIARGVVRYQVSATSPDGRLRVSYAAAIDDLAAVGAGLLSEPASVVAELDRTIAAGRPALALTVDAGPGR